jgi:hypothetical protein
MASLILPIVVLFLVFALMKRWFPTVFNYQKRIGKWALKETANRLWKKPEKKGGANIRQTRMKWRE